MDKFAYIIPNFLIKRRLKGRDDINLNNWMSEIDNSINIKDINIPGTHDSSTRFCQFSLFASCQDLSVSDMLNIGVRAFDLRVNGEDTVHSFCKCKKERLGSVLKFYDVIDELYTFLKKNPTEAIILFFKNDGKISGDDCLELLKNKINLNPEFWELTNKFPNLKDVRGKIILFNRINGSLGLDFSKMPYQGDNKTAESEKFSPNDTDVVTVQDRYMLPAQRKWNEAVKPLFTDEEKFKNYFVLNFLSSAGFPLIPRYNAAYINKKFTEFDLKPKGHYGTLMLDYITSEISEKIIKTNFYDTEER